MYEDLFKMRGIFLPHEAEKRDQLLNAGNKLVHYTSASTAVSIIEKQRVWMRNIRCMNDVSEVEHGISLMQEAIKPPIETETERGLRALMAVVDSIFSGISARVIQWFDYHVFAFKYKTYITCLSEHPESEDQYGRLSMWRAYSSGQNGVALIIDPTPFYSVATAMGAYSSPVTYFTGSDLRDRLLAIAVSVEKERNYILSRGEDETFGFLCMLLRSIAMCSKHPGFSEEREWRVMHTADVDAPGLLESCIECVGGFPQPVYKMPLISRPELGLPGIEPKDLLKSVIIGPTQYPLAIWDALAVVLRKAGIEDPDSMIKISGIPLRT